MRLKYGQMVEATAADSPPIWHRLGRVRELSKVMASPRPRQTRWPIRGYDQSTSSDRKHPRTVRITELSVVSPQTFPEHSLSGNSEVPRHVHARIAASSFPCSVPVRVTTSITRSPYLVLQCPQAGLGLHSASSAEIPGLVLGKGSHCRFNRVAPGRGSRGFRWAKFTWSARSLGSIRPKDSGPAPQIKRHLVAGPREFAPCPSMS